MNTQSLIRPLLVAAGLALTVASMAVTAVGAQQSGGNTVSTPGQTSIATDKDTYVIGEPITITYTLPAPGRIRITDHQAGSVFTLRADYNAQVTGTIRGTVTPPAGKECLKLEYTDSRNQKSTAETCFEVKEKESDQPQAETPVPGLYTLRHKETGLMLDSNLEKKVYLLAANGGAFQKWVLEAGPDGYFFLRNLATGHYLDSTPMGESIYTHEKNLGIYQQWKVVPHREGSSGLIVRATSDRLAATAQGVRMDNEGLGLLDGYEWTFTAVQP
jgi:hypothetical protein